MKFTGGLVSWGWVENHVWLKIKYWKEEEADIHIYKYSKVMTIYQAMEISSFMQRHGLINMSQISQQHRAKTGYSKHYWEGHNNDTQ